MPDPRSVLRPFELADALINIRSRLQTLTSTNGFFPTVQAVNLQPKLALATKLIHLSICDLENFDNPPSKKETPNAPKKTKRKDFTQT